MLCHAKTMAAVARTTLRIIAAIFATTIAFGAQAQDPISANVEPAAVVEPFAKWFRFDDSVKENWKIIADVEDPLRLEIVPGDGSSVSNIRIEPRFRVMVLYPRPSSAYDVAITKILNVFSDRGIEAEFKIFNFDRTDSRGFRAIKLAESSDIDLIFTMGSESTAWLWTHYKGGKIPVVSVTSKDPVILGQANRYDHGTNTNFAFTSLNMPVSAQLAYVFELRPQLRNLAVLVDSKNVSAMETQARPIAETASAKGIRVLNLEVQNPENARAELGALVSEAVSAMRKNDVNLENSLFWITGSTSVFREIKTINSYADRVPVLSVVPEVVQEGNNSAVLSIGISFESNAHLAAIYAIKVLEGEVNVGDLKVGIVSPPDIAINFRKAREIGLKIPFSFVEGANYIFDYDGQPVRNKGKLIPKS